MADTRIIYENGWILERPEVLIIAVINIKLVKMPSPAPKVSIKPYKLVKPLISNI